MPVRNNTIDFFSAVETFSATQDSIIASRDTAMNVDVDFTKSDVSSQEETLQTQQGFRQFDLEAIDSILRKSEERERQIQMQIQQEFGAKPRYIRKIDTTEILYKQFGIAGFPIKEKLDQDLFQQNFLYSITSIKPKESRVKQSVFIENSAVENKTSELKTISEKPDVKIKPKYIAGRVQFDWITIILIASFLLLGWVRLFNKKYLLSLVKSIVSYKESNTLYRDKNSLMERASFVINLLFISNISVFVVQLKNFFGVTIINFPDYLLYLIVLGSLISLYIFRAIASSFIGFVFIKQRVFSEYFHNVNIYTKNTGLVLFPIIIALQFIPYNFLEITINTAIFLIIILYSIQIIRSFQIIIRKNVSILYMILYLCAFEFAPFLIIYKLLLTLG